MEFSLYLSQLAEKPVKYINKVGKCFNGHCD